MAVEAAVMGNATLLKQAMMMDPLVGAVCDTNEIWQMTDEMLVAQAKWLPQYKKAIREAKKSLKKYTPPRFAGAEGAARLKTKSVEEMAADCEKARKMADASDKANVK